MKKYLPYAIGAAALAAMYVDKNVSSLGLPKWANVFKWGEASGLGDAGAISPFANPANNPYAKGVR